MPETPEQKISPPAAAPAEASAAPAATKGNDLKAEAAINNRGKEIFDSRKVSSDGLICLLNLAGSEGEDPRLLALAVERLLHVSFSIPISRAVRGNIKDGISSAFSVPSIGDLPERKVKIVMAGKTPLVEIRGVEAVDGEDGHTTLHFDWQKRAGALSESGVINWKDINSVPSVHKDSLLVTVIDRTLGAPGIDCFGKAIKQKPGKRHQIRWNTNNISRKDDPKNPNIFMLHTINSGAVEFRLRVPGDPKTLDRIDIADTFTIKGDINYDYGDIQSAASLEVKGNLKGNFSLQSEGFVHVSGSIEGQAVKADGVTASLITNGCRVTANHEIQAGNINNGIATAEHITIKQNASSAHLHARKQITIAKGAALLGIKAGCINACIEQARVSGVNEFLLGSEVFSRAEMVGADLASYQTDLGAISEEGKKEATTILSLLVQISEYTGREHDTSPVKKALITLKTALISIFQSFGKIREELITLAYTLQSDLGDRNYNESIIRRADTMVNEMKKYNTTQTDFAEVMAEKKNSLAEMEHLTSTIRKELVFAVTVGLQAMGNNAEIRIKCGNAELNLDSDSIPNGPFKVVYSLPEEVEDLKDGKLKLIIQEI
ncbi:MAG: FapA family protein [Proteobacteria bacterium]|nr:FapA family protein [Pseudomonadota bacterium]MBU1739500.1 FapA family protein [Pseudomonadota bacterium]